MHRLFLILASAFSLTFATGCAHRSAADASDAWRPLFNGTNLEGWRVIDYAGHGEISVRDGRLRVGAGVALSGVVYTNELPATDYEVALRFRKVQGSDFACGLTFPVKGSHATLILGGWGGGVVGVSSLDGLDASQNETTIYRGFEADRWYDVRLAVTDKSIRVWLDDKSIIDVDISERDVDLRAGEIEISRPFSVSSFQTTSEFDFIRLRPLSTKP